MKKVIRIITWLFDLQFWFLLMTHLIAFMLGLLVGSFKTQWRLESYILKHPVYQFDETKRVLHDAATAVADGYIKAGKRLNTAAEMIDSRYSELDRLSINLNEYMKKVDRDLYKSGAVTPTLR